MSFVRILRKQNKVLFQFSRMLFEAVFKSTAFEQLNCSRFTFCCSWEKYKICHFSKFYERKQSILVSVFKNYLRSCIQIYSLRAVTLFEVYLLLFLRKIWNLSFFKILRGETKYSCFSFQELSSKLYLNLLSSSS